MANMTATREHRAAFVLGLTALAFALTASGGIVLADDGAATSLSLHGRVADRLRLDLDGIVVRARGGRIGTPYL